MKATYFTIKKSNGSILEYIVPFGAGRWSYKWSKDPSYKDECAIEEPDLEKIAKRVWSFKTDYGTKKGEVKDIFIQRNDDKIVSLNDYIDSDCSFEDALYKNDFEDSQNYYVENKATKNNRLFESILSSEDTRISTKRLTLKESEKLNEFGGPKSWSAAGRDAATAKAEKDAIKADSSVKDQNFKVNINEVKSINDIFIRCNKCDSGLIFIEDTSHYDGNPNCKNPRLVYEKLGDYLEIELPFSPTSEEFSEFEDYTRKKLKSLAWVDFSSDADTDGTIAVRIYVAPNFEIDDKPARVLSDFWRSLVFENADKTYLGVKAHLISDETKSLLASGHINGWMDNRNFDKCFYKEDNKSSIKVSESAKTSGRRLLKESHKRSDFDKFKNINKYLARFGDGDNKGTQATAALRKLIYKWFIDGEVFDTNYGLQNRSTGWVNDLSGPANWLYHNVPETQPILNRIKKIGSDEDAYTDLLYDLVALVDPQIPTLATFPKEGNAYDEDGPFFHRELESAKTSSRLNEIDTYVDPRSKVKGWKVKVLDVEPDEYGGSTTATVELFDPDGNSQGEDVIYVHRKAIKIGQTYDAYIDGIMASPKIKGVEDIPYSEVPDMRKATKDLYCEAKQTKKQYLKDFAEECYEIGHPLDPNDFDEFAEICAEDGYEVTTADFDYYWRCFDDCRG